MARRGAGRTRESFQITGCKSCTRRPALSHVMAARRVPCRVWFSFRRARSVPARNPKHHGAGQPAGHEHGIASMVEPVGCTGRAEDHGQEGGWHSRDDPQGHGRRAGVGASTPPVCRNRCGPLVAARGALYHESLHLTGACRRPCVVGSAWCLPMAPRRAGTGSQRHRMPFHLP